MDQICLYRNRLCAVSDAFIWVTPEYCSCQLMFNFYGIFLRLISTFSEDQFKHNWTKSRLLQQQNKPATLCSVEIKKVVYLHAADKRKWLQCFNVFFMVMSSKQPNMDKECFGLFYKCFEFNLPVVSWVCSSSIAIFKEPNHLSV